MPPANARIPSRRPRLAGVEDTLGEGAGWLIFKAGGVEMGVHPTSAVYDGKTYESPRTINLPDVRRPFHRRSLN